jgi:hypothetical protein
MTRPVPVIAGTVAATLLLFGAYMGSYYAMLNHTLMTFDASTETYGPIYKLGGPILDDEENEVVDGRYIARRALLPAHNLDRLVRWKRWSEGPNW